MAIERLVSLKLTLKLQDKQLLNNANVAVRVQVYFPDKSFNDWTEDWSQLSKLSRTIFCWQKLSTTKYCRYILLYLSVILCLEFYWSSHVWRSSREYPSRWSPSSTISPHRQPLSPVTAPVKSSGLVVTLILILGYCLTYEQICNRENSYSGYQIYCYCNIVHILYTDTLALRTPL